MRLACIALMLAATVAPPVAADVPSASTAAAGYKQHNPNGMF